MSKTQSNRSVPKVVPAVTLQPDNRAELTYERRMAEAGEGLNLFSLEDDERAFLGTCQRLYHNFHGCSTPFEEFFWSLVHAYTHGAPLTPDWVTGELETFRTNFQDTKRDVAIFLEHYPQEFAVKEEAA